MSDERMPPADPRIEAFLESLASERVPADLAFSTSTRVRERPGRRPSLRLPFLAGAAGLLAVVAVAMAAGWRPPIDLLPGPQASAPGPQASTAAPTPAVPGQPPAADSWEFATITVAGAEVRAEAPGWPVMGSTGEDEIGTVVLVREWRQVGDRQWVKVERDAPGGDAWFAWLAATVASEAPVGYKVPVLQDTSWLPCSAGEPPTFEGVASVTAAQRLACYGAGSFAIGPVKAVPIWDDTANAGTPAWLAGPATMTLQGAQAPDETIPSVPVRLDPALGLTLPTDAWLTVTVHLDDAAAASCVRTADPLDDTPVGDASDQLLWCRQQLVATGYTVSEAPTPAPTAPPTGVLDAQRELLADAPIAGRAGESAVWTGTQLVIWGGETLTETGPADSPADGAAINLLDGGAWRIMAPSPLGARRDALIAWTGREVLVWGGTSVAGSRPLVDGAAWNPATDAWRMLAPAPLPPDARQSAAWAGDAWEVVAGTGFARYDAAADRWARLPDTPAGPDDIVSVAWADDQVVLLTQTGSGAELWSNRSGQWMSSGDPWVSRAPPPIGEIGGLAFGGGRLWAIGVMPGGGPRQGIAWWDPATDAWSQPIDSAVVTQGSTPVWNGSQLVVVGAGVAAFDPVVQGWLLAPAAPGDRVRELPSVVWAGDRVIAWGGTEGEGDRITARPDGWQLVWVSRG